MRGATSDVIAELFHAEKENKKLFKKASGRRFGPSLRGDKRKETQQD